MVETCKKPNKGKGYIVLLAMSKTMVMLYFQTHTVTVSLSIYKRYISVICEKGYIYITEIF